MNTSVLGAELWSLRDGLQMAVDLNIRNFEVECEGILKRPHDAVHPLSSLIFDCRVLMEQLMRCGGGPSRATGSESV